MKHSLGESAYNERRSDCESAVTRLDALLPRSISSLRDVTIEEFTQYRGAVDRRVALRADHVIGENTRVLDAVDRLGKKEIEQFGELMYASHESSRHNFENSCAELDWIVDACRNLTWVYGARLSGGGFGGNAVVLTHRRDVERTRDSLERGFFNAFGSRCTVRSILVSDGAEVIE